MIQIAKSAEDADALINARREALIRTFTHLFDLQKPHRIEPSAIVNYFALSDTRIT